VQRGISAVGAYLPNLRVDRKVMAREYAWSGLSMPRSGLRALAGWDEDTLTMAVEAARELAQPAPAALRIASASAYYSDRAQSAIALDALSLPRTVRTSDLANSRRAGTSALLDALLGSSEQVVIAADKRMTKAGSAAQLSYGDGAAAVRVGQRGGARLIGHASLTHDLVDRYASRDHPTPYAYEERFVRDRAVSEIIVPAVQQACAAGRIEPAQLAYAAVAEPVPGTWAAASRKLKTAVINHCQAVSEQAGDLGTAMPLFGLGLALAAAKPGDHVLVVGFGSGADALVFEVMAPVAGAEGFAEALAQGTRLASVTRFLNLVNAVSLDWGMRSEFQQKAQASVMERVGRDMIGFVGGRDSQGNVQFPKSEYPVNPAIDLPELLEDVRLADQQARIISITADRLNFSPDPPFDFGLVQFDNGARVLMEMVDRPAVGFAVGEGVRMRLRIKSQNRELGSRTYFWKAAPLERPMLGDA
jgi:hydroxymethylglutaryl-CoA synthase